MMDDMKTYILYGFGILLCVAGLIYLTIEYIMYLSEMGKLAILVLITIMFASFGKYLEDKEDL